jgi:hypothetical protein
VRTRLALLILALAWCAALPHAQRQERAPATPSPQASDLDQLMAQVLSNRDENWKKLQQYVLDEQQTFTVTGPGGIRLFGGQKEYRWFPREGFFIRSPTRADGVAIGDDERRREEDRFLRREQARERRRAELRKTDPDAADSVGPEGVGDILRQTVEPEFVSSAYFLRFKFDEGHYALVGREKLFNRDVLTIEYYPTKLFADDNDRERGGRGARGRGGRGNAPEKPKTPQELEREKRSRDRDARIERQMNKVAKATLWVDPVLRQILQYQLHNIEMDFLPGRSMVRVDELNASMKMTQPFPEVWLPDTVEIHAGFMTAVGRLSGHYDVKYADYRLAETSVRIR